MKPTDEQVREMIALLSARSADPWINDLSRELQDHLTELLELREAIRDVLDFADIPSGLDYPSEVEEVVDVVNKRLRKTGLKPRGEEVRKCGADDE